MKNIIEVKNVSKTYKDIEALKDVSFSVKQGHCCGLLGTNGAGKSTLIKILIGQLSSDSGDVFINGLSSQKNSKAIHNFIGVVPDSQALYEDLTVWQNIDIFRRLYGLEVESIERVLKLLEISDKLKTKVKKLSKGQKQRVLICRAIIHKPKLLILDEPTIGLDPGSSENIYRIINNIKEDGVSVLMTTHQMNDVERLCDYIVFLNKGIIVEQDAIADLKAKYGQVGFDVTYKEGVIKSTQFIDTKSLKSFVNELNSERELISIDRKKVTLEEIFINATKEVSCL